MLILMHQLMKQLLLSVILVGSAAVHGQTPFWSEDFSGGMPTGWVTEDLSTPVGSQNVTFIWSNDSLAVGPFSGGIIPSFDAIGAPNGYSVGKLEQGFERSS